MIGGTKQKSNMLRMSGQKDSHSDHVLDGFDESNRLWESR